MLATLAVKGRAPKTGYGRAQFGTAWTDDVTVALGHNGCDTRNDILRRDLTDVSLESGTNGCVVLRGTLADPYSARALPFTRGQATSSDVQIDHVVPLSLAWQTGAQQLGAGARRDLANDPLNLLAVDGPLNQQKSDGDAATWLPPNTAFRCEYVARMVAVKAHYRLWVTPPERDAISRILSACPGQPLPVDGSARVSVAVRADRSPAAVPTPIPAPVAEVAPPPAAQPEYAPAPAPAPDPPTAQLPYENCAAARAAGAAPVHRGDPGYQPKLDRDNDGVGCE